MSEKAHLLFGYVRTAPRSCPKARARRLFGILSPVGMLMVDREAVSQGAGRSWSTNLLELRPDFGGSTASMGRRASVTCGSV
jgi:hypothetical protein